MVGEWDVHLLDLLLSQHDIWSGKDASEAKQADVNEFYSRHENP